MQILSFDDITEAVLAERMPCGEFVARSEVFSFYRHRPATEARSIIAYVASAFLRDASWPKIGRLLGRDHATTIHGVNVLKRQWQYYLPVVARVFARLLPRNQELVIYIPRHRIGLVEGRT